MKILMIGPYAPHGQVGAIRVISLSRHLSLLGHDVSVLCLSEECLRKFDAKGLTAAIPDGIKVHTYSITLDHASHTKKIKINEVEFRNVLTELLKKKTYDAAIVSAGPFYTFNALKELGKRNIPYIVDYRDLNISSVDKRSRKGVVGKAKMLATYPSMFQREKKCLDGAMYVTVVSPEMGDNLAGYFHIDRKKIHVAYNGFDDLALKAFQPNNPQEGCFTIGYFGKLMYYNRSMTEMMFEAIEEANRNGKSVKLLHIGPENNEIPEYLSKAGLNRGSWYSCTGQKNYTDGMELLSSCDACALEYAYPEGPGTKVFDYIFLNKPILAVTKPGIPLEKMLKLFDHAYVCHSKDDFAVGMQAIMENGYQKLIDGEKAQEMINGFSRSKQNEVFVNLLEAI